MRDNRDCSILYKEWLRDEKAPSVASAHSVGLRTPDRAGSGLVCVQYNSDGFHMAAILTVFQHGKALHRITVTRQPLLIGRGGRDVQVHVRLEDAKVSRQHIMIYEQGSVAYVRDLDSTNGTLLDGRPLPPQTPIPLQPYQTLTLGDHELSLEPPVDLDATARDASAPRYPPPVPNNPPPAPRPPAHSAPNPAPQRYSTPPPAPNPNPYAVSNPQSSNLGAASASHSQVQPKGRHGNIILRMISSVFNLHDKWKAIRFCLYILRNPVKRTLCHIGETETQDCSKFRLFNPDNPEDMDAVRFVIQALEIYIFINAILALIFNAVFAAFGDPLPEQNSLTEFLAPLLLLLLILGLIAIQYAVFRLFSRKRKDNNFNAFVELSMIQYGVTLIGLLLWIALLLVLAPFGMAALGGPLLLVGALYMVGYTYFAYKRFWWIRNHLVAIFAMGASFTLALIVTALVGFGTTFLFGSSSNPQPFPTNAPPDVPTRVPQQQRSNGLVQLAPGFLAYQVPVQSGGPLNAVGLGGACAGYVTDAPTVQVVWSGASYLVFGVESAGDTTLVVRSPDGQFFCNDDTLGINPVVELIFAPPGTYGIWVGSFEPGAAYNATLVIAE